MPQAHHRIHLSVPHLGTSERGFVEEAFTSNWLSTVGPHLAALEQEFQALVGIPNVAVSSGTAALHLAVRLLGVGPGDEVVVPTLTFVATANAVRYQQGTPVFMDCERSSWGLDPQRLADFLARRSRAGRLPKAVMAVHLFGQAADIGTIQDICRSHGVPLIEDAANAIGTWWEGRPAGSFGDASIFSLGGNKIITSTCGGIFLSSRTDWLEKVRFWSTQARESVTDGVPDYLHRELGHNYRMSNVLAGIARGQLRVLEERIGQRRAVFDRYRAAFADLPGISPQPEPSSPKGRCRGTRWLSCFLIDEAKFGHSAPDVVRRLGEDNIEGRLVWRPMHQQPLYQDFEAVGGEVADDLHQRGICLPSSSSLTPEDQQRVIDAVRAAARRA